MSITTVSISHKRQSVVKEKFSFSRAESRCVEKLPTFFDLHVILISEP